MDFVRACVTAMLALLAVGMLGLSPARAVEAVNVRTDAPAIDLTAVVPGSEQLTVVTTRTTPDVERLHSRLPAKAHWIEMAESPAWNTDAALNAMTVPIDIVQALVARIEETCP